MKTITKAIAALSAIPVAGIIALTGAGSAFAMTCAPGYDPVTFNGVQVCSPRGDGGVAGGGTATVGNGASTVPGQAQPVVGGGYKPPAYAPSAPYNPPPAYVPTVPAPVVRVPVPVAPAPAQIVPAPAAPAPVIAARNTANEAPVQNATGGDAAPATTVPKKEEPSTSASASASSKPKPSAVVIPSVSATPVASSPAVSEASTPTKSPAELSAEKTSTSSPVNLSVLVSAALIAVLLIGMAMFNRFSFMRKLKGSNPGSENP